MHVRARFQLIFVLTSRSIRLDTVRYVETDLAQIYFETVYVDYLQRSGTWTAADFKQKLEQQHARRP